MRARPTILTGGRSRLTNALKLSVTGLLCLAALSSFSAEVLFHAGTRFIYEAEKAAEPLLVKNLSEKPYLLHSFLMDPATGTPAESFMVLPEVIELAPSEARTLTVRRLGGHFPSDRESRLALVGHFIPALDKPAEGKADAKAEAGHLSLAIAIEEKFFIRPAALRSPDAVERHASQITARLTPKGLLLVNPTPYFMSIDSMALDGCPITKTLSGEEIDMLAPMTELIAALPPDLPKGKAARTLRFRLINDAGYPTADEVRTLRLEGLEVAP